MPNFLSRDGRLFRLSDDPATAKDQQDSVKGMSGDKIFELSLLKEVDSSTL